MPVEAPQTLVGGAKMWHSRPRLCSSKGRSLSLPGRRLPPSAEHSRGRLCHNRRPFHFLLLRIANFAKRGLRRLKAGDYMSATLRDGAHRAEEPVDRPCIGKSPVSVREDG